MHKLVAAIETKFSMTQDLNKSRVKIDGLPVDFGGNPSVFCITITFMLKYTYKMFNKYIKERVTG